MKTFHWRRIETSEPLQMMLDILKHATRPLTGLEIQDEYRRRGKYCVNPGTTVGELGRNPGYVTRCIRVPLPGDPRRQEYRYVLIEAPGYKNPLQNSDCGLRNGKDEEPWKKRNGDLNREGAKSAKEGDDWEEKKSTHTTEERRCMAPGCGRAIDHGYTCNDECNRAWRESIRPKFTEPQGSLL